MRHNERNYSKLSVVIIVFALIAAVGAIQALAYFTMKFPEGPGALIKLGTGIMVCDVAVGPEISEPIKIGFGEESVADVIVMNAVEKNRGFMISDMPQIIQLKITTELILVGEEAPRIDDECVVVDYYEIPGWDGDEYAVGGVDFLAAYSEGERADGCLYIRIPAGGEKGAPRAAGVRIHLSLLPGADVSYSGASVAVKAEILSAQDLEAAWADTFEFPITEGGESEVYFENMPLLNY